MFLDVSQLSVQYAGRSQRAVDQASFSLQAGEIGVLIGPSGCGKTTLLRAVAGLERANGGSIRLAGDIVSSPKSTCRPSRGASAWCFRTTRCFRTWTWRAT